MIKLLNWIIETFYPDKMFYGKKCNPFTIFTKDTQNKNEAIMIGAMFLANFVADNDSTEAQYTVYGVKNLVLNEGIGLLL